MADRTLYVVMGTTGEYSDRREWPVRAFLDPGKAADLVVRASARAKELAALGWWNYDYGQELEEQPAVNIDPHEFDPNISIDYTGTGYYVMEVPLDEAVQRDIAAAVAGPGPLGVRAVAVGGLHFSTTEAD